MPHEFEVREEITLDATPEQVWQAIATGPGVDSWFMGHSEFEPRAGGATSFDMFSEIESGRVTAWEPGKRFAYRSDEKNGEFMAFEYLLEARDGGSTVLRFVHNGFLGDDGWADQYDALKVGDRKYLEKLAAYVKHFEGRTAVHSLFLPGPRVEASRAWPALASAFALTNPEEGDRAHPQVGPSDAEGTVTHADETGCLIVATPDALYTLMLGMGAVFIQVHNFNPSHQAADIDTAWQSWLEKTFA